MPQFDETIAAIVTPPGVGGIGVIRVSGSLAFLVAQKLSGIADVQSHRAYHFWLPDNLDEVVATFFKSPHSFTGEDTLEISCHGSPVILRNVLNLLFTFGIHHAKNGEFTKRAFLNGRIDLLQAESVLSMVSAQTSESSESAAFQLRGGLSEKIKSIKKSCLDILSIVQASIDFPDDVSNDQNSIIRLNEIVEQVDQVLSTAKYGRLLRDGVLVVISGKPNVGKSSLMNSLLNQDRVLVSSIPGTTRDAIIEAINIKGLVVRLADTAGIHTVDDSVESMGIDLSNKLIQSSDLVLFVVNANEPLDERDLAIERIIGPKPCLRVFNKIDIGDTHSSEGVRVSAKTGQGVRELETAIYELIVGESAIKSDFGVASERQISKLILVKQALRKAIENATMLPQLDIFSMDLQDAVSELDEMLGVSVGDEVLEKIFSEFCVGK